MKSYVCLNRYLSINECSGMNIDVNDKISNLFNSSATVTSLDDPQIIITLRFIQRVSITQIQIESGNKDIAPSKLKIFVGRDDLDFNDIEDMDPTETFDLTKNLGKVMRVNIPRFRKVDTMTVRKIVI